MPDNPEFSLHVYKLMGNAQRHHRPLGLGRDRFAWHLLRTAAACRLGCGSQGSRRMRKTGDGQRGVSAFGNEVTARIDVHI